MEPHDTKPVAGAEHLARAVATRYGFRAHDYALTWDAGRFDPNREVHELAITTKDGRSATVRVGAEALGRFNPWTYFAGMDRAFEALRRREESRGD
jgi:hypothetical protein